MNIRDFNVFIVVAETKHLTKASKLLYMTPQGVSKVIKNLENECDCELFLRTGNGMELFQKHVKEWMDKIREGIITR